MTCSERGNDDDDNTILRSVVMSADTEVAVVVQVILQMMLKT